MLIENLREISEAKHAVQTQEEKGEENRDIEE